MEGTERTTQPALSRAHTQALLATEVPAELAKTLLCLHPSWNFPSAQSLFLFYFLSPGLIPNKHLRPRPAPQGLLRENSTVTATVSVHVHIMTH